VAATLLVALSACSSGRGAEAEPLRPVDGPVTPIGQSGSATPTSVPTTPGVDRGDALAVYRAWWKAVEEAFARGDATYADLAAYGADPILTKERNQIRALRAEGIVQRTQLALTPRVLHQDGVVAEIADCVRGPAGTYYDVLSGKPRAPRGYRNDVPTEDPLLVSLQKRGGTAWVVVAAISEGVQPC
jgi:hypothetical protein